MHCALAQHLAVDAVIAGGGDGADDVGGVDVLDVTLTLRGCIIHQQQQ
jgi:hypothetical protein